MRGIGRALIVGALAGAVSGFLVAAVDVYRVLADTGAFYLRLRDLFEAVAVFGAASAVVTALFAAGLWALLASRADREWLVFRIALAVSLAFGLMAILDFHLYDAGMATESRKQLLPYAVRSVSSLLVGATLFILLGFVSPRWGRSLRSQAGIALAVCVAVVVGLVALREGVGEGEFGAGDGQRAEALENAPDLVLIVLDTMRADGLSAYGNPRSTSPHLDRLAREGLRYERAYATGSWTSVSHASMFTGTYGSTHGTYSHNTKLGTELPTLAEALASRGYHTLFASTSGLLVRRDGWARGFEDAISINQEDYSEFAYRRFITRRATSGTRTAVDLVLRWMQGAEESGSPFFVFMNVTDPHVTYVAREPYYSDYMEGVDLADVDMSRVLGLAKGKRGSRKEEVEILSDGERAVLRALYDSEVAYLDAQLSRLLEWLQTSPRTRPLVVVITSDHGELLGEHDMMFHGKYPYEELIHIPFLVWSRPSLGSGVSDELVSLVDIFPTFLALSGEDAPPCADCSGRDLLGEPSPEAVFAEHWRKYTNEKGERESLNPRKVAIAGSRKLIWESEGGEAFFDLSVDKAEQRNLSRSHPEEMARMRALLDERFDLEAAAGEEAEAMDPETRRHLEALGYLE